MPRRRLLVVITVAMLGGRQAGKAAPPADFQNQLVLFGLQEPISLAFLPDGRMLVLEKGGRIVIADPLANPAAATPYMTLPSVDTEGERGLTDITLDPDFVNNDRFYLYYAHASSSRYRISRFTHAGSIGSLASEVMIWQDNEPMRSCCHYGGGLDFGPDGRLYLTTGEEFDAVQAQDLKRAGGKVIRINADGSIPLDNPFVDGPGGNLDEIWAYGLRNPFRARWDLSTGRFFIAEVGGNDNDTSQEDIHLGQRGAHYGWPICEGNCAHPAYTDPIFTYPHAGTGAAITGGIVYRGNQFPTDYVGAYFYGDYVRKWIRYLTFDASGNVAGNLAFEPTAGLVVAIEQGPDGSLYYIDLAGSVRRFVYDDGNQPPLITLASADVTVGPAPLTVNFSGAATDDGPGPLGFRWTFGDGSQADGANVSHVFAASGLYTVRLEVSDGKHTNFSGPIEIAVGSPPNATILSPADGSLFRAGDTINLSASGTDEDGPLTGDSFSWTVLFVHNEHTHPAQGPIVGTSGSFDIPVAGHDFASDTGYRIILTVTDSDGLVDTRSVIIRPDKVNVTFDTMPSGLIILLDGIPRVTPLVHDTMIGFEHTISAPMTQCANRLKHHFQDWSDAGAASHVVTVPDTDQTIIATYQAGGPLPERGRLLEEDFACVPGGEDPLNWFDTGAGNGLVEVDNHMTFNLDGELVFGTTSTATNIHSHYVGPLAGPPASHEFSGRMRITSPGAGIGVTFLSDFPNRDAYYRLRRFNFGAFEISPHGTGITGGNVNSGVVPEVDTWYRFKVDLQNTGSRTEIRARIWAENAAEPADWQLECYDDGPTRLTTGTIGVWSLGSGTKYWDDLVIMAPCYLAGDFDCDGDVDLDDLTTFQMCASGPNLPMPAGCEAIDLDEDSDVDQRDFGIFQRCVSPEGKPGDPGCAD